MAYIHAYLGYPTKAAMLDAATAGSLIGILYDTATNIRRFYPKTIATPKRHLDQQRHGFRPTRPVPTQPQTALEKLTKEDDIYVTTWDLRNTT